MGKIVKPDNKFVGYHGDCTEEVDEIDHFYICGSCGQAVDKRDLGQVFHHEDIGHEPITIDT